MAYAFGRHCITNSRFEEISKGWIDQNLTLVKIKSFKFKIGMGIYFPRTINYLSSDALNICIFITFRKHPGDTPLLYGLCEVSFRNISESIEYKKVSNCLRFLCLWLLRVQSHARGYAWGEGLSELKSIEARVPPSLAGCRAFWTSSRWLVFIWLFIITHTDPNFL